MQATSLIQKSPLTGAQVKAVRKAKGLTAEQLAKELRYTRAYIKSIEGGSLLPSARFIERFFDFQRQEGVTAPLLKTPAFAVITTKYRLPVRITLEARPRRCRVCRQWFVFAWPNQRVCKRCKRHPKARSRK